MVRFLNHEKQIKDLVILGRNLKFLRESQGKTLKEYAAYLGYDRNKLSNLEYGEMDIQWNTVIKMSKLIDFDVIALFSDSFIDDIEYFKENNTYQEKDFLTVFRLNSEKFQIRMGLTKTQLASDRREYVSRLLNGKISNPRVSSLSMIAGKLGLKLSDLFKEEE